jgi:hypothetical protein
MGWKFNHNEESFEKAVGISRNEVPQSSKEIIEAIMSGKDKDIVRVAVVVFLTGEAFLSSDNPVALLMTLASPELRESKPSHLVENIYRSIKMLINEFGETLVAESLSRLIADGLTLNSILAFVRKGDEIITSITDKMFDET